MVGPARESIIKMQEIGSRFAKEGKALNREEALAIATKVSHLERQSKVQEELNSIFEENVGSLIDAEIRVEALNQAYARGFVTLEDYNAEIKSLRETLGTSGSMGLSESLEAEFESIRSGYESTIEQMTAVSSDFFTGFTKGATDSFSKALLGSENLRKSLSDMATGLLESIVKGLVEMGVQMAANWALSQIMGAKSSATTLVQAQLAASAWSTPAALASLATGGANAAGATAAITSVTALSKGMAAFKDGGYTGNQGVNDVAGVVHGQEYVMDAQATKRIGVGTLEAMQAGKSPQGASNDSERTRPAGDVNIPVNVVVVDSRQSAEAYLTTDGGKDVVVEIIESRSKPIARILENA